jgi:hypothetical protein
MTDASGTEMVWPEGHWVNDGRRASRTTVTVTWVLPILVKVPRWSEARNCNWKETSGLRTFAFVTYCGSQLKIRYSVPALVIVKNSIGHYNLASVPF